MPLPPEVLSEIDVLVRGGFEDRDRIVRILCEESHEPGELVEADVASAVEEAIDSHERDKATWPSITDCDQLDAAFAALNTLGIIALQNAGYTQSDGYDDVLEIFLEHANREDFKGYCYYHGQDLERAVAGQGLYFSFGPMDPQNEETEGPQIGARIVEELKRVGFSVEWNGTFAQRIRVPEIDWKRR